MGSLISFKSELSRADCHLDVYTWGSGQLAVAYSSRAARNDLLDRLAKSTRTPIGERVLKVPFTVLAETVPEAIDVIDGWRKRLRLMPALLATGLAAMTGGDA